MSLQKNKVKISVNNSNINIYLIDINKSFSKEFSFNIYDSNENDYFNYIYNFMIENITNIEVVLDLVYKKEDYDNLQTIDKIAICLKEQFEEEIKKINDSIDKINEES